MEPEEQESILFYQTNKPFGEFSNFYKSPIEIDGKTWPTTEHYFQAMKFFPDEEAMEEVRLTEKAMQCKVVARGQDDNRPRRADWAEAKDQVMYTALTAKFTQHETLKELLLSTDGKALVEHTKNDSYWADGGDGSGQNMLGKLLMQIRDEIKSQQDGAN
eukprot:CAMPEP_0168334190 /NCGR_PEP_ID=MMETSP0213-20121227/10105_1 /TAXON_ID=151035 /ORGANISM="Euplotes harpa, Strain FSP1.4" /LENGTH=159 /DNA_ID=CAMNT_0008338757 /DNA_START=153 /DNA_END=632 /DNA_ORIENTATION=+